MLRFLLPVTVKLSIVSKVRVRGPSESHRTPQDYHVFFQIELWINGRTVLAADRRSRGKRPGNARNRSAIGVTVKRFASARSAIFR